MKKNKGLSASKGAMVYVVDFVAKVKLFEVELSSIETTSPTKKTKENAKIAEVLLKIEGNTKNFNDHLNKIKNKEAA